MSNRVGSRRLFPTHLPEREWVEFRAAGFSEPVHGVIYRTTRPPSCGMPLGGIGTGCLDLEVDGTFGYSSIFNSIVPRRGSLHLPFLGISLGGGTWVLTTTTSSRMRGTKCAKEIHYWGHYPVADLEYETDAPVSVGLRAWSPFIPGDEVGSNTPGAVFEIHLRNESASTQSGAVAFSFPGISTYEREYGEPFTLHGKRLTEELAGIAIPAPTDDNTMGYVLAAIGEERVRTGGGLEPDGSVWSRISAELPSVPHRSDKMDCAASVAVDFDLAPGETKLVRIVLAWYNRQWSGIGIPVSGYTGMTDGVDTCPCINKYTYMYTERLKHALDVAEFLAREHASLLKRVLSWQQAIYSSQELPGWLRDCLVNILHLIAEDSLWAAPKPPVEWAAPNGVFGLIESPRDCPQMDCMACDWYGCWPTVYFFPDLALTTMRAYKHFVRPNGHPPFNLGRICELAKPCNYDYQKCQNGTVYASMVDRLWQYTHDDEVLREFYPSVKSTTEFTVGLATGPDGIVTVDGANFFEVGWPGIITNVAGMRLAGLRIAQRMAEAVGDREFAAQCREWVEEGSRIVEEKMWHDQYYLLYSSPTAGRQSDNIMANQLDGEWMTCIHGVPPVFDPDRVKATLATLKRTVVARADCGVVNVLQADGTQDDGYRSGSFFLAELFILAMTYMYNGESDLGLEITRKCMDNIVCKQAYTWDIPNSINVETAKVDFGTDYYQSMMLWALPLALQGGDVGAASAPGGLVDRVIQAGRRGECPGKSPTPLPGWRQETRQKRGNRQYKEAKAG